MKNIEKTQKRSIKGPVSDKRTVGWCETADGDSQLTEVVRIR